MRSWFRALQWTILALAASSAAGTARGAEPAAFWNLRGVAALSAEGRIALAKASAPIYRTLEQEGVSLRGVISEACGEQPPETLAFLTSEAKRLNLIDDPDKPISKDVTVAVPFCLKVERDVPVKIEAGDTPESILKKKYGVFGRKTVGLLFKRNAPRMGIDSLPQFESSLPVGKELMLPLASAPRIFMPRSGSSIKLPELLQSPAFDDVRSQMEASVAPAFDGQASPPDEAVAFSPPADADRDPAIRYKTIESVQFQSSSEKCGPDGISAKIVDMDLLKERFAAEEAKKESPAQPVKIGIIDSGLATVGDDFFKTDFFAPSERERNGQPGVDDDDSGVPDDVYGINMNTPEGGNIEPYAISGRMRSHGTKMAALILGGPSIAPTWTGARADPLIHLVVINFASSTQTGANVEPVQLGEAISYLTDRRKVQIVNMSLANGKNISGPTKAIAAAPNVLFVVAAGNALSGPGRSLDLDVVYPARYGGRNGEHKKNVLTVGAADLDGNLARFSNFSKQYVDLIAPGCGVETRDDQKKIVLDNGTSPATAIASFAAGLITSLGIEDARDVKNRLLLSTDYDPGLTETSWSSGRLNIVRAISLRSDVISVAPSEYRFGKLADGEGLKRYCGNENVRQSLSRLLKVIPNIPGSQGLQIEFWTKPDGETLERITCPQVSLSAGDSIGLIGEAHGPSLADVRDITFAGF